MNINELIIRIDNKGIVQFDIDENRNALSFQDEMIEKGYLFIKKLISVGIERMLGKINTIEIDQLRIHSSYKNINIQSDEIEFIKINRLWLIAHENILDVTIIKSDFSECSELNVDILYNANNVRLSGFPILWIASLPNISKIGRIDIADLGNSSIYLSNIKTDYCSFTHFSDKIERVSKLNIFMSNIDHFEINTTGVIIEKCFLDKNNFKNGFWNNLQFKYLQTLRTNFFKNSFIDIDFPGNKNNFILKDVNFEGNSFSNIDWGEYFGDMEVESYLENEERKIKKSKIPYSTMKELYRRLKNEHDSVGNKTEANKFFAKEMEYHMENLWELKDWKNYWIACFQKHTNNFGNDWTIALGWYFSIALLGALIAVVNYVYSYNLPTWFIGDSTDMSVGQIIISYLNPLPKFDDINSLWYLIISLGKFIMVYQIGVALRRISQR